MHKVIFDDHPAEYKLIKKTPNGFHLNHRLSGNKIGTTYKDDWVCLTDEQALIAYNFIGEYRDGILEKKLLKNQERLS